MCDKNLSLHICPSSNEDWEQKIKEEFNWEAIFGKNSFAEKKMVDFIRTTRLEAQRVVLEEILALTEHAEGYCLKQLDGFDIREYAETKGIILPKITE